MRKLKQAVSLALFVTTFAAASAAYSDECDSPDLNTFDAVYCVNKVFVAEDARLNTAYGELRKLLSAEDAATLKAAQLNWIDYRNDICVGYSEEWGDVVYTTCSLETTRARAEFLEARINECKTVGCASSKLTEY